MKRKTKKKKKEKKNKKKIKRKRKEDDVRPGIKKFACSLVFVQAIKKKSKRREKRLTKDSYAAI